MSSELIGYLWAGEGYRFIGHKAPSGRFEMQRFKTTDEALEFAQRCSELGKDVWFSCGLFGDGSRTQDNFVGARAFWLDLDVDPENPHRFHSQAEALTDIKDFCKTVALPKPSIISSGFGIHAYWLLDDYIDPARWDRAAQRLKAVTAARGLRSGPERTADSASVMRIPGTFNYKRAEPAPVVELAIQPPMPYQVFMDALMRIPVDDTPVASKKTYEVTTPDEFDIPENYPPSSAVTANAECAQLRAIRDSKGNVEEPLWYAAIGLWRHTAEGSEIIHELSSGHPQYDPGETDRKIQQWEKKGIGPSTCAQFYGLNPAGCEGCQYKNNITSPIQLGVTVTESVPDYESEVETGWITDIKKKYFIGEEGVFMRQEDEAPVKILGVPMYFEKIGRLGFDDAIVTVHWRTPKGTWEKSEISLTVIGEKADVRKWLHKHSITSYYKVEHIMNWMKDFADELNQRADPEMICERFGWVGPAKFMIGDAQITASGIEPVRLSARIPQQIAKGLVAKGSLDTWSEVTKILDKEQNWPQAFALLAALSAPLFRICNVDGSVLSFAGPSGTGKTKGVEFACSAFGDPKSFVHAASSTLNAKGELLRTSNNLPLVIDEVGPIQRQLSDLIYMGANGQAKERLRQTGELYGQETWQTVLMLTTNSPIMDLPESTVGEAERRRVLELYVDHGIDTADVQKLHDVMQENYGLAARPYMQKVIEKQDLIAQRFRQISDKYMADDTIPDANRFGIWLVSAAAIAGGIAKSLGLIQFDPMRPVQRAVAFLRENVEHTRAPEDIVDECIRAYVNENLASISIKGGGREWLRVPEREVKGRWDYGADTVAIPIHRLKTQVNAWHLPLTALKAWLDQNMFDKKSVQMSKNAAPEKCYIIKNINLINLDEENSDEPSTDA